MRSYIRFAAILAAGAVSTSFATQPYKIDPAHSTIAFKVHQYLTTVTGKFARFSGTVDVDPDHGEKSSVAAGGCGEHRYRDSKAGRALA